jgi:hypothetical protein
VFESLQLIVIRVDGSLHFDAEAIAVLDMSMESPKLLNKVNFQEIGHTVIADEKLIVPYNLDQLDEEIFLLQQFGQVPHGCLSWKSNQ